MEPRARPCECCAKERQHPFNQYSLGCLYCGARLIKRKKTSEDRTKSLREWVDRGHSEEQIRALVAGKNVPIEAERKDKK